MIFKIEKGDLFKLKNTHYLAHCISQDIGMGAGIAIRFNKVYNMKTKLIRSYNKLSLGCILVDNVFNLVTKKKYWQKPNYLSLEYALREMKEIVISKKVKKIAMPKIGSGLDKLNWNRIEEIVKALFKDLDIEIVVRYI